MCFSLPGTFTFSNVFLCGIHDPNDPNSLRLIFGNLHLPRRRQRFPIDILTTSFPNLMSCTVLGTLNLSSLPKVRPWSVPISLSLSFLRLSSSCLCLGRPKPLLVRGWSTSRSALLVLHRSCQSCMGTTFALRFSHSHPVSSSLISMCSFTSL